MAGSQLRPSASAPSVRQRMQATLRRDTPPELKIRSLLHRRGYRFRVDARPLKSQKSRADIVLKRFRVAVYIDGCFWHGCPLHATWPKANASWWREKIESNRYRDARANAVLMASGWVVVRIWEHEDPSTALDRIVHQLESRPIGLSGSALPKPSASGKMVPLDGKDDPNQPRRRAQRS